jgi:hypothetical protein
MAKAITFTKAQVRRAVKGAESAGLKVSYVTVNADGSITVAAAGENTQVPVARPDALASSWDDV